MQLGLFTGIIYNLCNWITRLAYINLLWILFSLFGLIIFGFFPATIAMFATIRQFLIKNDPPIFKTFWKYYKEEFISSNILGVIVLLILFLTYFNLHFIQNVNNNTFQIFYYPLIVFAGLFLLAVCYFIACYVHFNQTLGNLIKNSILIMISNPLASLFIIFGFIAIYYANFYIPGISFFYSGSLITLVILSSSIIAFNKIEKKLNSSK